MKKMLVVLSVLLMLISCGKGENKENGVEKIFNNGKSDSKTSGNEIKKYNDYVNIYNRVLNIDKDFIDYFKDAGNQEQLKKDESPGTGFNTLNQDFINQIKEQAKKAPAMENLDKAALALASVYEELGKALTDFQNAFKDPKLLEKEGYEGEKRIHI